MKTKKIFLYVLMILPLVITLIALPSLPEQIPAHYNIYGQVDRWGSKYESLILPAISIVIGIIIILLVRHFEKKEKDGTNNSNVLLIVGLLALSMFGIMHVYFLYTSLHSINNLNHIGLQIEQLMFGLLGVFMIVVGNIMPKLRMNSWIGFRTSASMKNESVWKKSQRFSGISFIVAGVLIILFSLFLEGLPLFALAMITLIGSSIVSAIYSSKVAKVEEE